MKRLLAVPLMICLISPAFGSEGSDVGRMKADHCLGCHGVATYQNVYPTYHVPKLGGQSAAYIVSALRAYRSQDRHHPTMYSQAHDLSDEDMADIAAYFSGLAVLE